MAHEIDQSNNRNNMAYVGEAPWHGLGNKLTPDAPIETWKTEAGFEWSGLLTPVEYYPSDDASTLHSFPGRRVLYRSDTHAPLGIVSSKYKVVQPGEVLEFFRDLVGDLGNFQLETAGCLQGGKKVWALARSTVDDFIQLGKDDQIDQYLLLSTSYDFSTPTQVTQTATRVVCMNTLQAALNGKRLRISHNTQFQADAVKQELNLTATWQAFTESAHKLASKKVSRGGVREYFVQVFYPEVDPDDFGGSQTKFLDRLLSTYEVAPGQQTKSAKGTMWGALNAVTYHVDHLARTNGGSDRRLTKAWFGPGADIKNRAHTLALATI